MLNQGFLKTDRCKIVNASGKPVFLRGLNLGGWLMMEGYILGGTNTAPRIFEKQFADALGEKALRDFLAGFRDNFIQESDIANIARLGFNCLRVPFNSRLIEKAAFRVDYDGVKRLDVLLQWAEKYHLWIIWDMHGAPGAQNSDWHSDSLGKARLWQSKVYQRRTILLWEFLADRYKDKTSVAGYDLLNEPVLDDPKHLNPFYHKLIAAIRGVDKNHILFIEGNKWSTDFNCLDEFDDDNYALSPHSYFPIEYGFNMEPLLRYPTNTWNKAALTRHLEQYQILSRGRQVPMLVGEFGINDRGGFWGEDKYLEDSLQCFNSLGFHWTYWTYKTIKVDVFPDGIYHYLPNPVWVNRQGPMKGWDNYISCWKKYSKEIVESWKTKYFQPNDRFIRILKKYATFD
jgi:endoglucanase